MPVENYIKEKNGKIIPINKIPELFPATVFLSPLHVEVCEIIAKKLNRSLSKDEEDVYINLLFRKSSLTKQITGLIELINKDVIEIDSIDTNLLNKDLLKLVKNKPYTLKTRTNYIINYIDRGQFKIFIGKAVLNRIYRIFQKIQESETVIRSWVDVTEELYPKEFYTSQVLVYPFVLNIRRQFKFFKHLFKHHNNWTMAGLPYSIISAIHLVWAKNKDVLLVKSESSAYLKHSREILKKNIHNVLTSDDFESASIIMHKYLTQSGVYSFNTAHGIGFSLPRVYYKKFKLVNQQQKKFYLKNSSSSIEYELGAARIKLSGSKFSLHKDSHPIVVFIHGNCASVNLIYEGALEDKIMRELKSACAELNMKFKVKLHPNASELLKNKIEGELGIDTFKQMDKLKAYRPVFITLFSTAYYDFANLGPFIFVHDNLFDPCIYFGDDIETSEAKNFKELLNKFLDYNFYKEKLDIQVARLKNPIEID